MKENQKSEIKNQKYRLYFYSFAAIHLLVWTLLPALMRDNIPLDSIEAIAWGYEWQFGYVKHPPLSAWLAEGMMRIFSYQLWVVYLLAQLCVVSTFIATWKLAKDFLPRQQAFMAVLLLECIYYYNFTSIEFNANIMLLPLWAWVTLYCWKVTKNPHRLSSWIILAVLCALALLAKYYVLMLLAAMFLFFIFNKNLRQTLHTPYPYLAALLFTLLLVPHVLWLIDHDFVSVAYIKSRTASSETYWYNHLLHPFIFACSQFGSLLLACVVFFNAGRVFKVGKGDERKSTFLIFAGLVPFLLTITPSLISGSELRDMWGSVLWSWFGIALFYFFQPKITPIFQRRFYIGCAVVAAIAVIAFVGGQVCCLNKYSDFDGKLLVKEVSKHYQKPIINVTGDVWLASNMNFYANPRAHAVWDPKKFSREGGILMWNAGIYGDLPGGNYLEHISGEIIIQEPIFLPFLRFPDAKPYHMGWAIVVPRKDGF